MKRFLLYPVHLLAFAAVLLWDSILPRRKLPAVIRVVNEKGRALTFEHYPEADTLVVRSPACVPGPLRIYDPEDVSLNVPQSVDSVQASSRDPLVAGVASCSLLEILRLLLQQGVTPDVAASAASVYLHDIYCNLRTGKGLNE